MIDVTAEMKEFAKLLSDSYGAMEAFFQKDKTGSLREDYLQAVWELCVEGTLSDKGINLEVYGEGADCNGTSSRVLYPSRNPTHRVICKPKTPSTEFYNYLENKTVSISGQELRFDRFVTLDNGGWYLEQSPFDKSLVAVEGKELVVDNHALSFNVEPIE